MNSNAILIDHMGSDKRVIQAARLSFNDYDDSARTAAQDEGLIRYLATGLRTHERNALIQRIMCCNDSQEADEMIRQIQAIQKHFAPFTHCMASIKVTAPIFVARQLLRSQIGLTVSEVSRRYIDGEPEFWSPTANQWRKRAKDVKQGSLSETIDIPWTNELMLRSGTDYAALLFDDIAPEQARSVLSQAMLTTWLWTGSLYAFARIALLRLDPHAQREAGEIAEMISGHLSPLFPVSWRALVR